MIYITAILDRCSINQTPRDFPEIAIFQTTTVVWATLENCNSTLLYGTDPWSYQNTVTAEMVHFDKPTMTGLQ
jgi:hypothetical protein